jgi:hypothetical protein
VLDERFDAVQSRAEPNVSDLVDTYCTLGLGYQVVVLRSQCGGWGVGAGVSEEIKRERRESYLQINTRREWGERRCGHTGGQKGASLIHRGKEVEVVDFYELQPPTSC